MELAAARTISANVPEKAAGRISASTCVRRSHGAPHPEPMLSASDGARDQGRWPDQRALSSLSL